MILCMLNFCRLTNSVSNTEVWKHGSFGQFVLKIIPSWSWEAIARDIPLQIVFECLDEFLYLNKVHTYSSSHTDGICLLAPVSLKSKHKWSCLFSFIFL